MIKKAPTAKEVLYGIAETFAKIEVHDRRVTRVNMSPEVFCQLMSGVEANNVMSFIPAAVAAVDSQEDVIGNVIGTSGAINPLSTARSYRNNPVALAHGNPYARFWEDHANDPNIPSPNDNPVAALWGAEIYLKKNKFEVLSDPIGSNAYPLPPPTLGSHELGTETPIDGHHWVHRFTPDPFSVRVERYTPPQILAVPVVVKYDPLAFLRKNLVIQIRSRACPIVDIDEKEAKAIETLREMISETEYRKYIKYGFVLVQGQSGAIYQIFRERSHTKVWRNGKVVQEVCVRIKDREIPPTDNVIAFKTLIEISEDLFLKRGNVYNMANRIAA